MKQINVKSIFSISAIICGVTLFALPSCMQIKATNGDTDSDAVFSYREIYLPESAGENARKFGLNNMDEDWGLWGHNLYSVLPEKKSESIYAKKNGVTYHDQYCFSSNRLYEYVEEYISNNYSDDDAVRFAILPNDNEIVCQCVKCVEAGNTKKNASPAVFNFINRLSERFPKHQFYTSYYLTTKGLPKDTLPDNVGVLVSAMDYPLSPVETSKELEFISTLRQWKQKTNRIFVWDYINNFDDYFTPYPVFDIMKRRLNIYKDNGVTAVFLNGSGTDYSTFGGIKARVLADLTKNPGIDWKESMRKAALQYYPVAGNRIADFLIAQEAFVNEQGKELPLYEGVEKALLTYLPKDDFIALHDDLRALRPQTRGDEKEHLDKLLGAMALTRLELNRLSGNPYGNKELLDDLKNLLNYKIPTYSEAHWTLSLYIRDYERLLNDIEQYERDNILKGVTLMPLTPLDPDYPDISLLTDGMLGIPSNYHSGNLIMSPEKSAKIAIPSVPGLRKLRVGLVYNTPYRVDLPEKVSLKGSGKDLGSVSPSYPSEPSGHVFVEFKVPADASSLVLTFEKDPDVHSIAIDEIQGFK